ncbi:MAG: hypothetical protein QNK03_06240 [Myxococcota bacterium]|nr:hypothetical protein [Myxococcota bacterium]
MAEAARPALPAPSAPWIARVLATAPVSGGLAVVALLLATMAVVELASGDLSRVLRGEPAADPKLEEYRFSVVFALLAGFLAAASAYAVTSGRRTLEALAPALDVPPASVRVGDYERRSLRRAGVIGVVSAMAIPIVTDLSLRVYSIGELNTAAATHRVMLPIIGWMTGRFVYLTLADSRRLARLGREHARFDLLDLEPLAPLARHGLRSALLCLGFFGIVVLLLPDWRARPGMPVVLGVALVVAALLAAEVLRIPLRGVRDAIAEAKRKELAWCRAEIRRRRHALAAGGAPDGAPLDELTSYLALIEAVRPWPLDASILLRFTLYLVIPLGSWLGAAMVERLIDTLLD